MTNVYQVLVFVILLGVKGDIMSVGSQCCKVKLNNFITQGRKTLIDILKIHWKSLRYTTEVWRTPFFYHSSVGKKDECRPLPTPMMKRLLSLVAGFAFTLRDYLSQPFSMTASET